jgi:DNA-binding response OmpR family regulator
MSAKLGAPEKVKEIGANGFVNKPFDADKLVDRIKTFLASPNSPYFIL